VHVTERCGQRALFERDSQMRQALQHFTEFIQLHQVGSANLERKKPSFAPKSGAGPAPTQQCDHPFFVFRDQKPGSGTFRIRTDEGKLTLKLRIVDLKPVYPPA